MAHYDLEAAERKMRADVAAVSVIADQMIAEGKADASFIAAQRYFDDARIQFLLASLKGDNDGMDRNEMLASAAMALGTMTASLILSCVGERERNLIQNSMANSCAQTLAAHDGADVPGAHTTSTFTPEEGGHA